VQLDVRGQRYVSDMDLEDLETALLRGPIDSHMAVKAARTQQGRVEDIGPIGRRQYNHALIRREAIHLGQDLVERLFPFVMAPSQPGASDAPHRIDLIDEQDAGAVL